MGNTGTGDWTALLRGRAPSFADVHDPSCDKYAWHLWENLTAYVSTLQSPEEYCLPSSRYACARELQARQLPFLAGLTLGRLRHVVQLAVSQKGILGYRDGALVPYTMSTCFLKKQQAEVGCPSVQ